MSRERTLVTCPVCKTDQHIYAGKICKHIGLGALTCLGSKTPIKQTGPELKMSKDVVMLPLVEDFIKKIPINLAKSINGITVNSHYELDEGEFWLETDCADHDAWCRLPPVVEFNGRRYGKAGWNSDSNKACYSSKKLFATTAV